MCVCCRLAFKAAQGQDITAITTGAIIAHEAPTREINAYAKIYVALTEDIEESQNQWNELCDRVAKAIDYRFQYLPNATGIKHLQSALMERVDRLQQRIARTHQRQKRGLFNFVSSIASSLFGIPSASDLESLKEVNRVLASEVEGIVDTQRKVIGKVNLLGRQQQVLAGRVDQVIQHIQSQEDAILELQNTVDEWNKLTELNQDALRMGLMLDILSDHISQYEEALGQAQAMRVACEGRLVTEQLLPVAFAQKILDSGNNRQPVSAMEYYAYIQVKKITRINNQIFCVLHAPLFSDASTRQVTILTFPMCKEGQCVRLYQPDPFIADYHTEDLYFPDECHGPIPQACRPGVKYGKTHLPCLHGFITGDPTQQAQCPVTLYHTRPPPQPVSTATINRYIVEVETEQYHYRCPGGTLPTHDRFTPGVYLIDIEPRCVMDADRWILHGLPTFESNYTRNLPKPQPINLTWFKFEDLPKRNLSTLLPAHGLNPLQFLNYEEIRKPEVGNVANDIRKIQSTIGKPAWWLYLIVTLVGLLCLAMAVFYIRYRCRKLSPSMTRPLISEPGEPIQLSLSNPAFNEPLSRDTSVAFNNSTMSCDVQVGSPQESNENQ